MAKSTAQLLLVCLAVIVGAVQAFMISPNLQANRVQLFATSDASSQGEETPRSKSNKPIPICLIAADQVLLPGETATIWTEEERLIDDCVEHHYGVFAMGVVLVDEDSDEKEQQEEGNNDLLEIASLVEVKDVEEPDEDGDGLFVTVTCVGRVRLERLQQTYPYFKFRCTTVEDKIRELPTCHMVADNIEAFMKKLSRTEEELDLHDDENHDSRNLLERYKNAYGRAMETGTLLKDQSRAAQLLTAISWAAFTSIEDPELEHYRARALDFDDLFERLKLAQYVMREKELRLQGHAMRSESEAADDGDAGVVEDACFTEGFQ
jgi:hypothetical protein